MLLPLAALLAGLLMLAWSGEQWVQGARAVAHHGRMPPLLVGLVVVGFGHSAPELAVAAWSASQQRPGLALGNAWGAHIVNIGLILAVTALVAPVRLRSRVLRREPPMLLAATALTALLVADSTLSRGDAFVLLAAMAALLIWAVRQSRQHPDDALAREIAAEKPAQIRPLGAALWQSLVGATVLAGGSALLVWGAAAMAWTLGISDLAMGLSVIALGCALPELAACVAAARQGDDDVVLGTVLGAALFNLLAVAGLTAAIAPADIEPQALTRDLPVLAGMTLALFVLARRRGGEGLLRRPEAVALLAAYGAYLAWLLATLVPGGGT